MSNSYWATAASGGAAGAMDNINGNLLFDGDKCTVLTSSGVSYYHLASTSGASESIPNIITPDSNPGTKRWLLSSADNKYYVNAAAVDQGVSTDRSIKNLVDTIGTSKKATLVLSHNGVGNTTTYTLTTSETIPSNITLEIENGAILDGAGTLTINGLIKNYNRSQYFGDNITVVGTNNSLQKFVYPESWGIDGVNDEVQIQKAINYTISVKDNHVHSAGIVDLDAKVYICNSQINIIGSNVILQGKGASTTIRRTNGGSYHSFLFAPADTVNSQIYEVGIKDLKIVCTDIAPTGGSLIRVKSVHGYRIDNINLQDGWDGLQIIGSINGFINNLRSYYSSLLGSETAGTHHIYIDEGDHAVAPTVAETYFDNFELNGSTNYYASVGIFIKSADGIWFTNGHIHRVHDNDLYVDPTTNQHITGIYFNHVYFDSCGTSAHVGNGVTIAGNSTASYHGLNFNDCMFYGGSGIRGASGLRVQTTVAKEISIINCVITGWHSHGIDIVDCTEFTIQGNRVYGNNRGDIGASGIFITDSATDFNIQDNQVGRTTDSPAQNYGVYCGTPGGAGVVDAIVSNNLCKGNVANNVFVKGTSGVQVNNNIDGSEASNIISQLTVTLYSNGEFFNITGTTNITSVTASWVGRTVKLKFTDELTFTNGSNLKLMEDFFTQPDDIITIVCDGTDWFEVSRIIANSGENILINQDFSIWQENTAFTNPGNAVYTADGYYIYKVAGGGTSPTINVKKNTVNMETGFGQCCELEITNVGASGATRTWGCTQVIEDYKKYRGKIITLSVRVKSSVAMTLPCRLTIYDGVNAGDLNIASIGTTWTTYSIAYTVLANATMLNLFFLPVKTTGVISTTGSIYIQYIKLELGSVATPLIPRKTGDELKECQRYYQKSYAQGVFPGAATGPGKEVLYLAGVNSADHLMEKNVRLPVVMKAAPTVTLYDLAGNSGKVTMAAGNNIAGSAANVADSNFGVSATNGAASTVRSLMFHYTAVSRA